MDDTPDVTIDFSAEVRALTWPTEDVDIAATVAALTRYPVPEALADRALRRLVLFAKAAAYSAGVRRGHAIAQEVVRETLAAKRPQVRQ